MTRQALITGIGALWSGGASPAELVGALSAEHRALGPLERLRAEDGSELFGGVIDDGAIDAWVDPRERRTMDRFGRINVAGARRTVLDAGYTTEQIGEGALADAGLVLSTTFGPWESTNRFVRELIEEGPLGTSARVFPNTVLNSAQGRVAINLKMKGPSSTLCGIPAPTYALDLIELRRADRVLAGSADEIYPNQLTAYSADGTLAPQAADRYLGRPFDPTGQGATAGEGFAACFLETEASAAARGATGLARILGDGSACDGRLARSFSRADREGRAFCLAIQRALARAELPGERIDAVIAAANGCPDLDLGERTALAMTLGPRPRHLVALKAVTGECFGASVALALVAAVGLLGERPEFEHVLVNGVEIGGNHVSYVVGRAAGGARS